MGMGYCSNYSDVVSKSFIKRLCPKQFKAFMDSLIIPKWELEDWARYLNDVTELNLPNDFEKEADFQDSIKFTDRCWSDLREAFYQATKVDMSHLYIDLEYHSPEEGDIYDGVSGAFFVVGGVYELTPAGKKFQQAIERKFYVTFG